LIYETIHHPLGHRVYRWRIGPRALDDVEAFMSQHRPLQYLSWQKRLLLDEEPTDEEWSDMEREDADFKRELEKVNLE
jgi:hypothetical protein